MSTNLAQLHRALSNHQDRFHYRNKHLIIELLAKSSAKTQTVRTSLTVINHLWMISTSRKTSKVTVSFQAVWKQVHVGLPRLPDLDQTLLKYESISTKCHQSCHLYLFAPSSSKNTIFKTWLGSLKKDYTRPSQKTSPLSLESQVIPK